jgi:hypothetical protein
MSDVLDLNIPQQFAIEGRLVDAVPQSSGMINDTFVSSYQSSHGTTRYVHQRINQNVFKEPVKVMENIERVTHYARERILAAGGDPDRESLTLVPTRSGASYYCTPAGDTWRTYLFIEGAHTYEVSDNPTHVYQAAKAFGNFQKLLASLPGERLHETILNFHYTPRRFAAFQEALQLDPANRARECRPEIQFLLERESYAPVVVDLLAQGHIPERATHNDTKLNNVLIDDITGEGICVIDLDTTMPGSVLYDFGDLIRMGAATAAEDESDLSKVTVNLAMFDHLARGYLDAARDFLTPLEREHLVFGGILITYEQSIRFLMDYLKGDVYYKTRRPGQNLDRARNQIKMVSDMELYRSQMDAAVRKYSDS